MRRSRWLRSSWSPPAGLLRVGQSTARAAASSSSEVAGPSGQNESLSRDDKLGRDESTSAATQPRDNARGEPLVVSLAEAVRTGDAVALRVALAEREKRGSACGARDPINSPQPGTGYTPLHLAVRAGDVEAVGMLLGAGAYQNVGDADGLTPLHHAVKLEHEEVVGVLLKANSNPNHLSRAHYTPVHFACKLGNVPLVRALLRSRGKKDIKTKDTHSTPLHLAVLTRNQAVLEVLLETGESSFDINVTDSYGYTPLHRASQMGLPVMVRLLVSHGASKSFRGRWDWTALHWAASCGHGEVVRVLLELGAVQGIEDNDGNIAYDVAIDEGVRGLLDPAARRINARDNIHDRPASRQRSYTGIRGDPPDVATPSSRPDQEDSSPESTPRHDASLKVLANSPLSRLGRQGNWRHRPITPWTQGLRQSQEVKFQRERRAEAPACSKVVSGVARAAGEQSPMRKFSPNKTKQRIAGPHSPCKQSRLVSRLDVNVSSSSLSEEEGAEDATKGGGAWEGGDEQRVARRLSSSTSSSSSSSDDDDGEQSLHALSWSTQPYSPVTPSLMTTGSFRKGSPWPRHSPSSPINAMRHSCDLSSPTARESKVRHYCARSRLHALLLRAGNWRGEQGLRDGLQGLGFHVISLDSNSPDELIKAVKQLCGGMLPGDAAVLVYAGPSIMVGGDRYLVPGVASMDGSDGERFPRFHGMQVERLSRQLSARCVSVASAVVGDCSHVLEASCVMVVAIGKGNMPLAPTELCSRVVELFGKARKNALEVTTWDDE